MLQIGQFFHFCQAFGGAWPRWPPPLLGAAYGHEVRPGDRTWGLDLEPGVQTRETGSEVWTWNPDLGFVTGVRTRGLYLEAGTGAYYNVRTCSLLSRLHGESGPGFHLDFRHVVQT